MAAGVLTRVVSRAGQPITSLPQDAFVLAPAGANNTSQFVYEVINERRYLAWFKNYNISANIETPLSADDAADHFDLLDGIIYPWDQAAAHLYRAGTLVSILSDTHKVTWMVLPQATLENKRINPSTPSVAYKQISVIPL